MRFTVAGDSRGKSRVYHEEGCFKLGITRVTKVRGAESSSFRPVTDAQIEARGLRPCLRCHDA